MGFRYDTFCGLYCGACDVLQANQDGMVEELARAWGMDPGQLRCHGCKTDVNAVYCRQCGIKACARDRVLEYCFQCADHACPRLVGFWTDGCAHHALARRGLDALRRQGLDPWLAEQRARWSCPRCGAGFTWYDTQCRACGTPVYNCQDRERRILRGRAGDG
jgi:hypothetical protein